MKRINTLRTAENLLLIILLVRSGQWDLGEWIGRMNELLESFS